VLVVGDWRGTFRGQDANNYERTPGRCCARFRRLVHPRVRTCRIQNQLVTNRNRGCYYYRPFKRERFSAVVVNLLLEAPLPTVRSHIYHPIGNRTLKVGQKFAVYSLHPPPPSFRSLPSARAVRFFLPFFFVPYFRGLNNKSGCRP